MIDIIKASKEEVSTINRLAYDIWYPTYENVISKEQIDFMLNNIYSIESLEKSIDEGTAFYLMNLDNVPVGFIGLSKKEECLRIDKIYLLPETQGKGLGKKFIDFASEIALNLGYSQLELNVNRYNSAYHFYLKQGFKVVESVDIPYYQFVLNDYIMRKALIS